MRFLVPITAAIALAGCSTDTRVHTVAPNTYLLCDARQEGGTECTGSNPEKGIAKVCLPDDRTIASIRPARVGKGILVNCGAAR